MQKPKKLCFKGSDGHDYPFLAKPKDDLRKDSRWVSRGRLRGQTHTANTPDQAAGA
jgi:serine/threonine-protein kinase ATR